MGVISTQSSITSRTLGVETSPVPLTNWREAAAYFLAWGSRAAVLYLLTPTVLLPFINGCLTPAMFWCMWGR